MLRVAVNCFVIPNYIGLIAKWKQFFCLIGVWVWLCFVLFCFCLMSQSSFIPEDIVPILQNPQ